MKHKRKLPSITSRTLPSGQVRWQVYCGRDNKGKQRFRLFETQDEAEVHLKKISTAKLNEGAAFWQLTDDQRREALDCYRILDGRSTLREAVQHYADKVLKFRHDKTVREASLLLVEKLTERGLADISLRDITYRLRRFSSIYGDRQLATITREDFDEFVRHHNGITARTKINYAMKIGQLFNYGKRQGWCGENPAQEWERPQAQETEAKIFTVDEVRRLLAAAPSLGLLPFIALAFFSGLRPNELQKIDWSAVRVADKDIIVGTKVAKKRRRRVVPINDTLAAWLVVCEIKTSGPVTPPRVPYLEAKLSAASGVKWKQNALRHSFASYHLAMFNEPFKTAYLCGHTKDPAVLHDHYKALVSKADAEQFWALRPTAG